MQATAARCEPGHRTGALALTAEGFLCSSARLQHGLQWQPRKNLQTTWRVAVTGYRQLRMLPE